MVVRIGHHGVTVPLLNQLDWPTMGMLGLASLAVLALIGFLSASVERRRAPRQLDLARHALEAGALDEALNHLTAAFYAPLDDVYSASDARVAAEVVALLGEVLRRVGHDPGVALRPLQAELLAASASGGRVPARLTRPLRRLLTRARAGRPIGPLVDALRGGPQIAPPVAVADPVRVDGSDEERAAPEQARPEPETTAGGYAV